MSHIRIVRNKAGNCINFLGTTNPAYWNACLSAQINPDDANSIDIINDIRSATAEDTIYEFFRIPYTEFRDADDNPFPDATTAAEYITANANVATNIGADIKVTPNDFFDFQRDITNTTIFIDNGDAYSINELLASDPGDGTITITKRFSNNPDNTNVMFGINHQNVTIGGSSAGTTLNGVINALNSLFTHNPLGGGRVDPLPINLTDGGSEVTGNDAEGNIPVTGTPTHLLVASTDTSGHGARYWSNETIDQAGEYFTAKITGKGRFIIGLGSVDDGDVAEMVNDTGAASSGLIWGNAFYNYGSYIAPWTTYGSSSTLAYGPGWNGPQVEQYRYNTNIQDAHDNLDPVLLRVGIDLQGYISVWYYDIGRSNEWILTARRNTTTEAGTYFLVIKLWDGNATLVETPLRFATDPTAPTLSYRYIESPDGVFHYPLFASQEEAEYVDILNGGSGILGVGTFHTHVYVDEPTNTTWYMPNTSGFMDASSAPVDTPDITYAEIPTLADQNYGPADLYLIDYSLPENFSSTNIQIVPQGALLATLTGLPDGLAFDGALITGTAPYVASDTTYPITVTRTNSYGTNTQSFNLNIVDVPSVGVITGFTYFGGNTVSPNRIILTDDVLLQYNTPMSPGDSLTYSYGLDQNPPTFGILSGVGTSNLAAFDPATDTLGTVQNVNNFAQTSNWDLRYVTFGGYVGGAGEKHDLVGWTDNAIIPGGATDLVGVQIKLEYGFDGLFRLYTDGTLIKTSNDTYTGPQTLTVAGFDDQQQLELYIPTNLAITSGISTTTPPVGFVDPVEAGEMTSPTLFGPSSNGGVFVNETLKVNHRYVIPQSWIDANVLPNIGIAGTNGNGNKFFFGVPRSSANFNDVELIQDFRAVFRLEGGTNAHTSRIYTSGVSGISDNSVFVNSTSNAFYDYALEWDGTDLHIIADASGSNNILSEPGVNDGGSFSRVGTLSNFATDHSKTNQDLDLVICIKDGASVNLSTIGLQQVRIPWSQNVIMVGESQTGNGQFGQVQSEQYDLGGQHAPGTISYTHPPVNAGYTYTYIYHPSMEAADFLEFRLASDNTTVYTTGVTTFDFTTNGDPSYSGLEGYKGITFAIPQDVPPLRAYFFNQYQSGTFDAGREVPISGSTYYVPVGGVTKEGPIGNQTGNNWSDQGKIGWVSVNEPVAAGERITLPAEFFHSIISNSPGYGGSGTRGSEFRFGFKDTNWTANGNPGVPNDLFEGRVYLEMFHSQATVYITLHGGGTSYSTAIAEDAILSSNFRVFFEITNSGNSIRAGSSTLSSGDELSATPYAEWSTKKVNTGDQGFGITEIDFMMRRSVAFNITPALSLEDVDIDSISEVAMPQAPAPLTTPWNKAIDFSGGSERLLQVSNSSSYNPIMMNGLSGTVGKGTAGASETSNVSSARPWACAVVFSADGNSSNQHIWNVGEGSGTNDDNIYLRLDGSRRLYFGWGRENAVNELYIGTITTNRYYGIYIGFTGERLSGSDATNTNLSQVFDVRLMSAADNFTAISDQGTAAEWGNTGSLLSKIGARMDRQLSGTTTIGGRGANRNFHGKIASMLITTLRKGQPMPDDDEIKMMIRDPQQWLTDYKVGELYRMSHTTSEAFTFARNDSASAYATQLWLMGDGPNDAYAQIRNDVYPSIQNIYPLNMIGMVSNDIQTVNIPGLTN